MDYYGVHGYGLLRAFGTLLSEGKEEPFTFSELMEASDLGLFNLIDNIRILKKAGIIETVDLGPREFGYRLVE